MWEVWSQRDSSQGLRGTDFWLGGLLGLLLLQMSVIAETPVANAEEEEVQAVVATLAAVIASMG